MKKFYLKFLIPLLGLMPFTATSQVLYSEDFDGVAGFTAGGAGTYNFAPGFLLRNVDNRTPDAQVAYVNEAWERREDFKFNVLDSAAFSTSWYSPVGAADDWMWTPLIGPLPANSILKWNGVTYDPLYPDGYEVRVMTSTQGPPTGGAATLGNQVSNSTVVYSTAAEATAWAPHTVPLNAYAGQSVYIGFRNNSNNQFILVIDDIKVEVQIDNDVQLLTADTVTEYTQIPKTQVAPLIFGGTIRNNGGLAQTNVTLTAKVFDESNTEVYSATSSPIGSLAAGAVQHVSVTSWTPPANAQTYTIKLFADATATDQTPSNDTLTRTVVISENVYARDNGNVTGTAGIGIGGGSAYMGQDFLINNTARISDVGVYVTRGYAGRRYAAVIWDFAAGAPNQIIAKTDTLLYPDDSSDYYIMPIHGGPFTLIPGRYAITMIEFDSTLAIGLTSELFTNNRTWVDWPSSPIPGWANNEDFPAVFSKSYLIRPTILPVCPASLVSDSATVEATCGAANGEASVTVGAGNYTYEWSNGGTTASITGLAAGNYSVTVTNTDLLCTEVVNLTVNNVGAPTLNSITGSSVNCFGDNGTATVDISGGTAPYAYVWSNGSTTASITASAGIYTVVVTDDNGCVLNAGPVEISSPADLTATTSSTNETCGGCNDGTASVVAAGGVSPYTYAWAPTGGMGATATGLAAGNYTVTVTDGNGCTQTESVTVGSNASVEESDIHTLNAYPNPSTGVFYVTSNIAYSGNATVDILDITGKVIYSQKVVMNNSLTNTTIHLEFAAKGTYNMRFTTDKEVFFRKLVIQ